MTSDELGALIAPRARSVRHARRWILRCHLSAAAVGMLGLWLSVGPYHFAGSKIATLCFCVAASFSILAFYWYRRFWVLEKNLLSTFDELRSPPPRAADEQPQYELPSRARGR